jgi:hypothetical protein
MEGGEGRQRETLLISRSTEFTPTHLTTPQSLANLLHRAVSVSSDSPRPTLARLPASIPAFLCLCISVCVCVCARAVSLLNACPVIAVSDSFFLSLALYPLYPTPHACTLCPTCYPNSRYLLSCGVQCVGPGSHVVCCFPRPCPPRSLFLSLFSPFLYPILSPPDHNTHLPKHSRRLTATPYPLLCKSDHLNPIAFIQSFRTPNPKPQTLNPKPQTF